MWVIKINLSYIQPYMSMLHLSLEILNLVIQFCDLATIRNLQDAWHGKLADAEIILDLVKDANDDITLYLKEDNMQQQHLEKLAKCRFLLDYSVTICLEAAQIHPNQSEPKQVYELIDLIRPNAIKATCWTQWSYDLVMKCRGSLRSLAISHYYPDRAACFPNLSNFQSLNELVLYDCFHDSSVDDRVMNGIRSAPSLQSLTLGYEDPHEGDHIMVNKVCSHLASQKFSLKSLSLLSSYLTVEAMTDLGIAIASDHLISLTLSSCEFYNSTWVSMIPADRKKEKYQLRQLAVYDCSGMGNPDFAAFLEHYLPCLTSLYIQAFQDGETVIYDNWNVPHNFSLSHGAKLERLCIKCNREMYSEFLNLFQNNQNLRYAWIMMPDLSNTEYKEMIIKGKSLDKLIVLINQ